MDTLLVMFQMSLQLEEILRRATRAHGLSPFEAVVLDRISEHPGINCSLIADRMGRPRQNVQRTLERLAERQFVERDPEPFGTKTCGWLLTSRGAASFDALRSRLNDLEDDYASRNVNVARGLTNLRALYSELRVHRDALEPLDFIPPPAPTP